MRVGIDEMSMSLEKGWVNWELNDNSEAFLFIKKVLCILILIIC